MSDIDPFIVIGRIPKGMAYQWVPVKILGNATLAERELRQMERSGWTAVPWKRHPKMPHVERTWVVVQDQLLMQKPRAEVEAERGRVDSLSRGMVSDSPLGGKRANFIIAGGAESWVRNEDAINEIKKLLGKRNCGPRGDIFYVEVSVGIEISDDEIDTAMALKLTPQEYMRRRIHMDTKLLVNMRYDHWDLLPVFTRLDGITVNARAAD